jgi:hypothetical protein
MTEIPFDNSALHLQFSSKRFQRSKQKLSIHFIFQKALYAPFFVKISSPFGVTLLFFGRLTPNDTNFILGETPNMILLCKISAS